jgi:organic radical activating enzyme
LKALINEIFPSIQGEGKYAGVSQLFIRFAGCTEGCYYCDTDYSAKDSFSVGTELYNNPISIDTLEAIFQKYEPQTYHSVSFTGGEPLIYIDFIIQAARMLKKTGGKSFLETSGADIERLILAASHFDFISLDLKTTFQPPETRWEALLSAAAEFYCDVYLKLVINAESSSPTEGNFIKTAGELLKRFGFAELWIQPIDNRFDAQTVAGWQKLLKKDGVTARFIPQIHKLIGIR